MSGRLFSCATPIGNLSDASYRLIDTLSNVDTIFAEDTRVSQKLLQRYDISTRLVSLQKFNERSRVDQVRTLLDSGKDVALISDAGTPVVSDPGALLISELISDGYEVVSLPGPSAVTAFLSISGLAGDEFYFGGFFPRKATEAERLLSKLRSFDCPLLFFESPNRILKSMDVLSKYDPNAHVVLGKEISKAHERIISCPILEVNAALTDTMIKGEWIFGVLLSAPEKAPIEDVVTQLQSEGLDKRQIQSIMQTHMGYSKNDIYPYIHQ